MSTSHKRVSKQFHRLLKNIASFSDGQAKVIDFSDSMDDITIKICPNDGLYKDAEFIFKIELDDRYPQVAPTVSCETPIYHPNIDAYDGNLYDNVCVSVLSDWTPDVDLESLVQAILFLFYQPNLDDPLSVMFTATQTVDEYEANVEKSLRGGLVDGFLFEKNGRGQRCCKGRERGDMTTERASCPREDNGSQGADHSDGKVKMAPVSRGREKFGENSTRPTTDSRQRSHCQRGGSLTITENRANRNNNHCSRRPNRLSRFLDLVLRR